MKKAIKSILLLAVFTVILMAGTVMAETRSEISIQDIMGRTVTIRQPVEKVVLTFNFEEYFAVTGEKGLSRISGWSTQYWKGRRQSTWDAFVKKFPTMSSIPDVGYVHKNSFNVESVIATRPDVVIMAKNDLKLIPDELNLLKKLGIPVVFVDYHSQTLENHIKSTNIFGKIMGEEERAREIVEYYKKNYNIIKNRVARLPSKRPKVYMEFSGNQAGPTVFGPTWGKKMWGAIIEDCGGNNIAKDIVAGTSGNITAEQILKANPDVIIFAGNYVGKSALNIGLGYGTGSREPLKNLEGYKKRPGWENLSAVKSNRMGALYHDLSRHIFDVAGIQFIAKMLYPEIFYDIDPQATLEEFYNRFFPVKLTGTFMVELL